MGALRAAELHGFGMIGIGAIFRAYRDGRLEGDDEVALLHATGGLDWAPLTVPMVEVRATLARLPRRPDRGRRRRAASAAVRDIYFGDRDWPMMENAACLAEGLLDAGTFRRLAAMHVPLKRQDALLCLAPRSPGPSRPGPAPPPPDTCFIRKLAEERQDAGRIKRLLDLCEEALAELGREGVVAADPGGNLGRRSPRRRYATSPRRAGRHWSSRCRPMSGSMRNSLMASSRRAQIESLRTDSSASARPRNRPRSAAAGRDPPGRRRRDRVEIEGRVHQARARSTSPMNIQPVAHSSSRTGL